MALREILAHFGFDIDHAELNKGEAGINHMVESIGSLSRKIGEAFALYKIKEFVQQTIEGALQLNHAAIVAGTTAEKLQSLQFAAEQSEVPVEALSMGLIRLQRSMFAADKGAMGAGEAFHKLGLNEKDLAKKDTTEAFVDVAEAIAGIQNPAEQAATAMRIFGRGGAQLMPMLKLGREGVDKLRAGVNRLGGGYTQDYIAQARKAYDASGELHMAWRSLSVILTGYLVPALTWITDKCTDFVSGLGHLNETVDISRIGIAAFAAVAVAGLSQIIPLVTAFALKSALPIAGWLLLGLAIEDIIGLFQGDNSLTGTLIDHFFGDGAKDVFVGDVTAMLATWQTFDDGVVNFLGTAGAGMTGWIVDHTKYWAALCEWGLKFIDLLSRAQAFVRGETPEGYNERIAGEREQDFAQIGNTSKERSEANAANYRSEFDRIRDAAATAKIAEHREAQLAQGLPQSGGQTYGPGIGTSEAPTYALPSGASVPVSQGVPQYMSSPQYFTDKSSTVIQTMPGTTDGQAKAIGAAVAKARRDSSEYRATANALESAVE
jgi:hypothetical protein